MEITFKKPSLEVGFEAQKVYPALENLEITPSAEEQVFNHPNSYGYDEVIVNEVQGEELSITPTTEEQINEGVYTKVITKPIPEEYIIPEGTIDITENGEVDVKNYDSAKVNIKATVTSVQSKGVDFIDYDGRILYSYTVEEAQALTELPELPSHKGLICQGWNWSLEDIKELGRDVLVGAMYITDDGKTRLYIHIEPKQPRNMELYFFQSVANGVEVDWGDDSSIETLGGSGTNRIHPTHQYQSEGDYIITLNPVGDCILNIGVGSSTYRFIGADKEEHAVYRNMLKKVEIGHNVEKITNYAFNSCYSLASITIPKTVIDIGAYSFLRCYLLQSMIFPNSINSIATYIFQYCMALTKISIPNSVTNIYSYALANCYNLKKICIPNSVIALSVCVFSQCSTLVDVKFPTGITIMNRSIFEQCYSLVNFIIPETVTSIAHSSFSKCYSLASLKIPKGVTVIGNEAFSTCCGVLEYDFSECEQVPTLNSTNAFLSIQTDCKIKVPNALYDEWIVATNWSTYASKIVKASEVV